MGKGGQAEAGESKAFDPSLVGAFANACPGCSDGACCAPTATPPDSPEQGSTPRATTTPPGSPEAGSTGSASATTATPTTTAAVKTTTTTTTTTGSGRPRLQAARGRAAQRAGPRAGDFGHDPLDTPAPV